jgi:SPP1 gp7 family putative phage head morphogenesis protein
MMQRIERNLRDFSAHKQATITSDLRKLLQSKDGKRERADWDKEAMRIMKRHNGLYLRAELDTATQAAQAAESWQEFERRKYLYPNLRYETAGDERVRESHRALDQVVRPVDDPFWNSHTPPLAWRCRCKLIQTDEAVQDLPDLSGLKIPKGFNQNPGKTGKLFGDDHPYFNQAALDAERIRDNAARLHAKVSRQEVREWAKEDDFSIRLPQLQQPVGMTNGEVKTVTGKPHREAASRNQLLYVLALLADKLIYLGSAADSGEHPRVKAWHYYGIKIGGVDYFVNIWRLLLDDQTERLGIHAITDTKPDFGGP